MSRVPSNCIPISNALGHDEYQNVCHSGAEVPSLLGDGRAVVRLLSVLEGLFFSFSLSYNFDGSVWFSVF